MEQTPKSILFYSNYCAYSKEVIGIIVRKNLRGAFVFICVDTPGIQVPTFVDRVPLIVTPTKQLVSDSQIQTYLELLGTTSVSSGTKGDNMVNAAKDAATSGNGLDTITIQRSFPLPYSNAFSFIDNDAHDTQSYLGYASVHEASRIETPQEIEASSGKKKSGGGDGGAHGALAGKMQHMSLENLVENRARDMQRILSSINIPVGAIPTQTI